MTPRYTWEEELALIREAAEHYGIDARFVAAIRRAEWGGPGREFGVLSVDAPTYEEQLDVTCKSVRNRVAEYDGNPTTRVDRPGWSRRLAYCDAFVERFAARWAPAGAPNDPHGMNSAWLGNVRALYGRYVRDGLV